MEAVLAWRHSYGEDPESRAAAVEATRMLEPALLDTVRERRDDPRDDAISFLWAKGREVADDWSEQDVLDNAKFLFEGGSETTAFLVCNAVHLLLGFPAEVRAATLGDPDAFSRFLEEVLRHTTVVHLRARRATADVELGGVTIRAGERVMAINAAANRDPARWERPDVFDPGRPRLFGHLAFNVGPRHCVGAHLARMEGTEAVLGLWRAFPDLALAGAGADAPAAAPIGFVSRAWRPTHLVHAPVSPDAARERVLLSPGRAPRSAAGYGSPHPG